VEDVVANPASTSESSHPCLKTSHSTIDVQEQDALKDHSVDAIPNVIQKSPDPCSNQTRRNMARRSKFNSAVLCPSSRSIHACRHNMKYPARICASARTLDACSSSVGACK